MIWLGMLIGAVAVLVVEAVVIVIAYIRTLMNDWEQPL